MPIFIVDKPLGLSSHDVVAKARKLLTTRVVGHAGTLDPLATGVLVVLSDEATKLSPFLTESEKHYLAWVSFGASTPTLDAEGPLEEIKDASSLRIKQIRAALPAFLELKEQIPPQYSAIKKEGVKAYEAARKGKVLDLPPRPAAYYDIQLLGFKETRAALATHFSLSPDGLWKVNERGITFTLPPTLGDFPTALLSLQVKAGTYIRAFARDLGRALGFPAHLSGLVRTRAGNVGLELAIKLADLAADKGLTMTELLPYPTIELSNEDVARVKQGQRLSMQQEGRFGLISKTHDLIAIAEVKDGRMKLLRVWN